VYLIKVPVHVCTVLYPIHQIQVRYLGRYQSIRPPLTQVQGGLLLGVGDGGRVVRYRTPFSQKIAQVLEEVDQRAFSMQLLKWLQFRVKDPVTYSIMQKYCKKSKFYTSEIPKFHSSTVFMDYV
jgi:hypothetical protein